MRKTFRHALAVGTACLTLAAGAANFAPLNVSADAAFKTVALGDSITTGYNIADSFRIPYADIVSGYYGGTLVNLAENGATSSDLLAKLQDGSVQQEISSANLILVTIGANDVMQPVLQNEYVTADGYTSLSDMIRGLREKGEKDSMLQLKLNLYLDKVMPDTITNCRANITQIAEQLRAMNPNAKIVFQTVYNPMNLLDDKTSLASSGTLEVLRAHVNRYLEGLPDNEIYQYGVNDAIRDLSGVQVAEVADVHEALLRHAYYYTEIGNVDVHPNAIGHMAIAERVIDTIGTSDAGNGLQMRLAYRGTDAAQTLSGVSETMSQSIAQIALQNTMGDVDCNGQVDITDASVALSHYATQAAGGADVLTGLDALAADVDKDNAVSIQDSAMILEYYAQCAAGMEKSFSEYLTGK